MKIVKKAIVFVILAVSVLSVVLFAKSFLFKNKNNDILGVYNPEEKTVDTKVLESELLKASELTTAKLKLTCMTNFIDKGIKFINRSDFVMVYDANVRAGIDMSKVKIPSNEVDNNKKIIYVYIPHATFLGEPSIDPNSIKYYDTKFSIINLNEKEDANKAQAQAQIDALKKAKESGILELADTQSETLIKGILSNTVSSTGYTIEIKHLEEE